MKWKKAVLAAAGLCLTAGAVFCSTAGPCAVCAAGSGWSGAGWRMTGSAGTARGAAEGNAASEALAAQLPMTMTFQREDGLFVSRSAVAPLPAEAPAEAYRRGDFLYLPESGRLAVVIRPEAAPAGSVRLGRMQEGRWLEGPGGSAVELSLVQ